MATKLLTRVLAVVLLTAPLMFCPSLRAQQDAAPVALPAPTLNLALVATPTTSFVSGHETLGAINDGFTPRNSNDKSHGAYGNWPRTGTNWVQYEWSRPISTAKMDVYWFDDRNGVRLPKACRISYWNGDAFVPVSEAVGLGLEINRFNTTTFPEITTSKLRLEFDGADPASTGILEWRVYDSGKSPNFPPIAKAGVDRLVVMPGKTYLNASIKDDGKTPKVTALWSKAAGPGEVAFEDAAALTTTATFSAPGQYTLKFTANDGEFDGSSTLHVEVDPAAPLERLESVYTLPYKISSPLLSARLKSLIVNWIPHCYDEISDLNLKEGGINNFIQAGNKLAGKPATRHVGYPFSNAWVHNTVESMSVALMVDPQGDAEIIKAQGAMRAKLEEWIPIILAAQEPDGYMQTRFTLDPRNPPHWDPRTRGEHEGYVSGYFIESAIAHYLMTNKTDDRLYKAARKLADCWYNNIGPAPKKAWYDGHEEMEQALVRLGRFVNDNEGPGKGQKYIELAKFLLDCRKNGSEYDQTHLPVIQQYEAVGHAVRASYLYSGMADVALETHDVDYQSAVRSLWDNLVNKKYYITGGIGSGETSEGFGGNYSLPNATAYCESCSNCGELFFQYKMNLAYGDAKYVDLYEETLYNAILGDTDLEGKNFTYTNALDSQGAGTGPGPGRGIARYLWHNCPCCVGNFPRTLLMMPTWTYAKSADALYVNLFFGSTVNVGDVAGTNVEMVQTTNYPWDGNVSITVNPAQAKNFAIKIRVPNRNVSTLYVNSPAVSAVPAFSVNGVALQPVIENGYAIFTRDWKRGDKIDFVVPMEAQRVKAIDKVGADVGRVALRYGPLIYNIESADQNIDLVLKADSKLQTQWNAGLLGGVVAIKGTFASGEALTAIPNYARNNRGGRSIVWIKDQ